MESVPAQRAAWGHLPNVWSFCLTLAPSRQFQEKTKNKKKEEEEEEEENKNKKQKQKNKKNYLK